MKEQVKAMLNCILDGDTKENVDKVEELTDRMITYHKPKTFTGKASVEIEYDKQFEDMCLVIAKNLNVEAKKMTVLEYYNAYQYIMKQNKAVKRQNKAL